MIDRVLCGVALLLSGVCSATAAGAEGRAAIAVPHVTSDQSVRFDYDIVYVRAPAPKGERVLWANTEPPTVNLPGAQLMLLRPDGSEDVLVPVGENESIADPFVSFDGQWVYYARYHDVSTSGRGERKAGGADIYKVHVATRRIVRLTHQERTANDHAIDPATAKPPKFVFNLGPCPLPGGRVAFVSDRNGYRGIKDLDTALQLFVMDDDGRNVELIAPMNLGGAMHPVILTDGRILFSTSESQGIRIGEQWGLWAIRPDGTGWDPMFSAFVGASSSLHFQTQLTNGDIVVEHYYPGATTQGFGTFLKFPTKLPPGEPAFAPAYREDPRNVTRARANDVKHRYVKFPFTPKGLRILTEFCTDVDIAPDSTGHDLGKVTHPSGAPENHMLLVWAPPTADPKGRGDPRNFNSGIYLIKSGEPVDHPSKMRLVKDDPQCQEMWPRALVSYKRIYGMDEPPRLPPLKNDGSLSPHLPAGTPFGLVGSSSLYKRESYPDGIVREGSVTGGSRHCDDPIRNFMELGSVYRAADTNNWRLQGADAGRYRNSDIWGIRIVALEPVTHSGAELRQFGHASGGNDVGPYAAERLRILGEFPVRKFDADGKQPLDPDGNPDTSFLAKTPADVAWTFQTIDHNGMTLNMAQTWHQLRPGEVRNNCGGCHAHSQQPTDFKLTAAAAPAYAPFDLTQRVPLFTTKQKDESKGKWDSSDKTGVRYAEGGVVNVEYHRDIKPIFQRSCVACHTNDAPEPAGGLVLDDDTPTKTDGVRSALPLTYLRLAWDNEAKYGPKPVAGQWHYRMQMSRYIRKMQARRSLLVWKIYGQRLDGFHNDDLPTERKPGDPATLMWKGKPIEPTSENLRMSDLDYVGESMPPADAVAGKYVAPDGRRIKAAPLSDEDRQTIARWIDLGCPIDLDVPTDNRKAYGWLADDQRPTLALTLPGVKEGKPIDRILIGMYDLGTGLDPASLSVVANIAIDGVPAGENLAARFTPSSEGIRILRLTTPTKPPLTLTVLVKDRAGNATRIERRLE